MLNNRWEDSVRNEDTKTRLEQPPVSLRLKQKPSLGHLNRTGDNREPRGALRAKMRGRRRRRRRPLRRPGTRWFDVVAKDLKK